MRSRSAKRDSRRIRRCPSSSRSRSPRRSRTRSETPPHSSWYAAQQKVKATTARRVESDRHQGGDGDRQPRAVNRAQSYADGYRAGLATKWVKDDGRQRAEPCNCLGIFGMSLRTTEKDLRRICEEFGDIEKLTVVRNRDSGVSRGFGFVYYQTTDQAAKAKLALEGAKIDGCWVRIDFAVTDDPSQKRRS